MIHLDTVGVVSTRVQNTVNAKVDRVEGNVFLRATLFHSADEKILTFLFFDHKRAKELPFPEKLKLFFKGEEKET